jgi:RNA polymerase sigma-70 factor (ECF subfamily)
MDMERRSAAFPSRRLPCWDREGEAVLALAMDRYSRGDLSVFKDLYRALEPRLRRFCLRLTGCRATAEDLAQDTLLRLHDRRSTYTAGAPVIPWVFAIARHAYQDVHRRTRRLRRDRLAASAEGAEPSIEQLPSFDGSPESTWRQRELRMLVSHELRLMSDKIREAYLLVQEEGLSCRDAGALLDATCETIRKRVSRAREQIRATLRGEGWDALPVAFSTTPPASSEERFEA